MKIRLIILTLFLVTLHGHSQSQLHIIDRAITFDGSSNKEVTKFINQGEDTLTYSISLVPRWMDSTTGKIVEDGDTTLLDQASPHLRIYPRTVVVPPNELQSVAVQLRRDNSMEPGEYRSHLLFYPVINTDISQPQESDGSSVDGDVGTAVKLYAATSIPVMIMVETLIEAASIENLNLTDSSLTLDIHRSASNRSLRGFIEVSHISSDGTEKKYQGVVAIIYREVNSLPFIIPFTTQPTEGVLKIDVVVYDENEERTILDTKEISLGS